VTDALLDTVAAASAEFGMQQLANWFPAERHDELRELLYDLAFSAICAYRDAQRNWLDVPAPSVN
jgi:hypothetical protein